ncbi:hypothetical protein E2C01_088698 [Portunus trituberculatus]|uniref:Uncharacterized protein n=1 Tax=Portunus trituberculatus TaxID=210409 RepID=A0A5B7JG57_PORTR|nr:hypothetical protein [Portunus trituberculatus]
MGGKESVARVREPNLHLDRGQDSTRALGDPSDPKAHMVPLYQGGQKSNGHSLYYFNPTHEFLKLYRITKAE